MHNNPKDALRHHVSGAIERGEAVPITAQDSTREEFRVSRGVLLAYLWLSGERFDESHHPKGKLPEHPTYNPVARWMAGQSIPSDAWDLALALDEWLEVQAGYRQAAQQEADYD